MLHSLILILSPGYFSCLHVLWDWVGADFLLSKELLGQLIVDISVWIDGSTADTISIHNQIIQLRGFKLVNPPSTHMMCFMTEHVFLKRQC